MDWHEGAALRREERALRRAERSEIERQQRLCAIYRAFEMVATIVIIYAATWLGFFFANI